MQKMPFTILKDKIIKKFLKNINKNYEQREIYAGSVKIFCFL